MSTIDVKIPAIGDYKEVPVIEVLVKPGDRVTANDSLLTLESEKATMDVPAPTSGTVRDLRVRVGDRVSEGTLVVVLEAGDGARAAQAPAAPADGAAAPARGSTGSPPADASAPSPAAASGPVSIAVPPMGSYAEVPVIEVHVKPGATVGVNDSIVTLESDKATMDVPSPAAGVIREVKVKVGDRVGPGVLLALLDASGGAEPAVPPPSAPQPQQATSQPAGQPAPAPERPALAAAAPAPQRGDGPTPHASPSVRKLARELGVNLAQVEGTGPRDRILQADVQRFVKEALSGAVARPNAGVGLDLPPWPKIDFAKFGPVELQPLSRIKKLSKANLSRNWVMIPHVTQHDEADITELEAFRTELNKEAKDGAKVTLLAFLVKAAVAALRRHPELNASLDGDQLVLKRYFHIGFAADTPNGLVVPVVRDADRKGLLDIARETAELAARAREGKLKGEEMQGGCFSISSLGGIGGSFFTPIINAPEVAILGVSRATMKPVWDGAAFVPRLMVPLSLSYDHRVVDGALAARFVTHLSSLLRDLRRAML